MKKIIVIAAMALLTLTASAQKIGRVNFNELVQLMPEADAARQTMQAASQEADETLKSMYEEYQSKVTVYQQKSSTWSASIKETKEKELYEIQQRLQEFQQTVQQELQQQQQQLMAPLYEKAQNTVRDLAKAKALTAVFDASSALYFDEETTVDLTPEARTALGIAEGRTLETLQQELAAEQAARESALQK